jgi:hypothetical protein
MAKTEAEAVAQPKKAYVPPHLREGFVAKVEPSTMTYPEFKGAQILKSVGFQPKSDDYSREWWLTKNGGYPHVHFARSGETIGFLSYSEGQQHQGVYGITLVRDNRLTRDYQAGRAKIVAAWDEKVAKDVDTVITHFGVRR